MKKISFKTLGCKVNQYETQLIREQFLKAGYKETDETADVYVINTCTVTQKADTESRRLARAAYRNNPSAKIIITGCYTEMDREQLEKLPGNIEIVKNDKKDAIIKSPLKGKTSITYFKGRTKAFLKVQDGCNNFCSFCKVPLVRGRSKSRPPEEVISEFSRLVKSGYKEIILCGICLGSWGMDPGFKLDRLLGEIELKAKGDYRIRLSSIEPWYVTDGLIKKAAGSKKICPHLHIPLQSGDDNILKRMNRRYSPSDFKRLVKKIRDTMPEIAFTTDILVGFPGETDKAFDNTLKTIEVTKPSRAHIFPYSPRKGTRAYGFGDLPGKETVNKRIKKLKALTDMLALEYRKGFEGKSLQVLVEDKRDPQTGLLTGYTDNYIRVILPGSDNLMGKFINTPLP